MAPITQDYREMTRQELYGLAQERDIEGRSRLSKDELVEALELDDVGPDAVTLLLGLHEDIRELFVRFDELSTRPSKKKQKLVLEVITSLMRYAQIEEQVFYPAVRSALPELHREVDEDLEEHHVAELLLSELVVMAPAEERYDAKVAVLIEHVTLHLDEEEQQLLPRVQDGMDALSRREIGAAMTAVWGEIATGPRFLVVPGSPEDDVIEVEAADATTAGGSAGTSRSRDRAEERADAAPSPDDRADAAPPPPPAEGTGTASPPSGSAAGRSEVETNDGDGEAMTRSEEELVVRTTAREAGTAQVRKHVVHEHVAESVPVERERAVVEREPVSEAERDAAPEDLTLSEDEREVLLHEEEAVAEKRTVPKERVRLGTRTRTDQEVVEGDVAREDIEVVRDDPEDEVIDLVEQQDRSRR